MEELPGNEPVRVRRWPSELPLRALVILAALAVWALLAFSIVGFVYALILAAFFFVAHVLLITRPFRRAALRLHLDRERLRTPEQRPGRRDRNRRRHHTRGRYPLAPAGN